MNFAFQSDAAAESSTVAARSPLRLHRLFPLRRPAARRRGAASAATNIINVTANTTTSKLGKQIVNSNENPSSCPGRLSETNGVSKDL